MPKSTSRLAIHSAVDNYDDAINALFEAVVSASPAVGSEHAVVLETAIDRLVMQEDQLATALDEVYRHRRNSERIAELRAESNALDRSLAEMMASLAAMHKKLTMTTKAIDRDPPLLYDTVDYETLIKYAERIAKFSRGPSKIDPSIALSSLPNLPWPTEDMMRRGASAAAAPLARGGRSRRSVMGTNGPTGTEDSKQVKDPTAQPDFREAAEGIDIRHPDQGRPTQQAGIETTAHVEPTSATALDLDLDLFDPDEDD